MTRKQLENWILRQLGYPVVRIELHTSQIQDCIDTGKQEYLKWANGEATNEVNFTVALSGDVGEYDLPSGVTDIISVSEADTSITGINTLFTVENYLYNQGALGFMKNVGNYDMLDYHLSLEFIDLLDRYTPNYYNWRYNRYTNRLTVNPLPSVEEGHVG